MNLLDVQANPVPVNLAIVAVAALAVWFAGSRLSEGADEIARRTGLGQAFVGVLFLAVATSLPEVATTVTASLEGNVSLAANNLLGSAAMQVTIIAFTEMVAVRGAMTFFAPRPVLLLQGVMLVALLAGTLAAISAGELVSAGRVGLWSVLLFLVYLGVLREIERYRGNERWEARTSEEEHEALERHGAEEEQRLAAEREERAQKSDRRLYGTFAAFSLVILLAGWAVARTGGALAEQTGLGQSFVGATLVAVVTALPEVSTTLGAARLGNYSMAFSNIFGSNGFMVALFFVSDLTYRQGLVFDSLGRASQFTAGLAIVLTCVYLWGLLERRDRTIGRMGIDSALVVALYLGGLVVLYAIRGQ
jgi:cation:H+ antiporter